MDPQKINAEVDNDVFDGQTFSQLGRASAKALESRSEKFASKVKNPVWPMQSSNTSFQIASKEYKESPLEKYVAAGLGDELPKMRDELIERKKNGEGFVERHAKAWINPENWKVDPDNNDKEKSDPIQFETCNAGSRTRKD